MFWVIINKQNYKVGVTFHTQTIAYLVPICNVNLVSQLICLSTIKSCNYLKNESFTKQTSNTKKSENQNKKGSMPAGFATIVIPLYKNGDEDATLFIINHPCKKYYFLWFTNISQNHSNNMMKMMAIISLEWAR